MEVKFFHAGSCGLWGCVQHVTASSRVFLHLWVEGSSLIPHMFQRFLVRCERPVFSATLLSPQGLSPSWRGQQVQVMTILTKMGRVPLAHVEDVFYTSTWLLSRESLGGLKYFGHLVSITVPIPQVEEPARYTTAKWRGLSGSGMGSEEELQK